MLFDKELNAVIDALRPQLKSDIKLEGTVNGNSQISKILPTFTLFKGEV